MRILNFILFLLPLSFFAQKTALSEKGMVVCAHPLASQIGAEILKKGGNAFDAGIAVQFALAVIYPNAGNLGGGGFMVARTADGKNICLDFREKAPSGASREMYLEKNGEVHKTASLEGVLAAGVPGTIDGIFKMQPYGRLPLKDLIDPAIRLAENGFPVTEREAAALNSLRSKFLTNNQHPVAFVKNIPWKAGDTLIQKELAESLKRIRDLGRDGFYSGITAQLIVAEMKRGKGLITETDLSSYSAVFRTALQFSYKNYSVITMPPPSSGGIILRQLMGMVEKYPVKEWGYQDVRYVHLVAECERRVFAERSEHMGDPDFFKVPMRTLTDTAFIRKRLADFNPDYATPGINIRPTVIPPESEETTHISIADGMGNAVSITTTLNGAYGSYTVVKGAGFLLNNEMDDFSAKPGTPNLYGLVGGEANSIAPNKRMLSSMTPTILLKDNMLFMVVGTPGGSTIPTSVFQTIMNVIEFELSPELAVNAPKFHHQWLPDYLYVEESYPEKILDELKIKGHHPKKRSSIGRTDIILILPDGKRKGVADNRGDDAAAGE
ncbi:MAG: gamma-glutamyltransferase [Bacteroidia bacterium]|nr:gamma-glutamyltransferase [Bacteroidia bacterium]